MNRSWRVGVSCALWLVGHAAAAQSPAKYDLGASDTEVKIGQTYPYSGPLSSASEISLSEAAYVAMINEQGGVNGRKVTLISLDDGYSPSKAIEQTRKLVEQDGVLAMFNQFGTPTSTATQKYLNAKGIPQLFCGTGSARFNDPSFPWSSSSIPNYIDEAAIFGEYVGEKIKNAKVAILYQGDDFGKDFLKGFKKSIAAYPGVQVIKEVSYEVTEPTIDSQINILAASGADVLLNVTTGRATAQSIRAIANLQWKPIHLLNGRWADIGSVFKPVGPEKAIGIISPQYLKSTYDPTWDNDPAMNDYKEFMKKYRPGADIHSGRNLQGYLNAQLLVHILRQAGNNLTRDNVNSIALSLRDLRFEVLLPSVKINTSSTQRHLISKQILTRFDGERLVPIE